MFLMLPGAQKSEGGGEDGQYEDDKNIEYIYIENIEWRYPLMWKDCRGHLSQNIYLL